MFDHKRVIDQNLMEPNDPRDPEFKAAVRQVVERYLQALSRLALPETGDLFLPEFSYKTIAGEILHHSQALQALQQDWVPPSHQGAPSYTLEGLYVTQGQAFAEITYPNHRKPDLQPDEMDPSGQIDILQRLVMNQVGGQWKLHAIEEMGLGSFSPDPKTARPY